MRDHSRRPVVSDGCGFQERTDAPKVAIVAALEREVKLAIKRWHVLEGEHNGRPFRFYENNCCVLVCGGIGIEAARRSRRAVFVHVAFSGFSADLSSERADRRLRG